MCTNPNPKAYKAIRLWGENLGSYEYYIENQQRRAAEDGAPVDAIYFNDTLKRWMYVRDLFDDHPFHEQYKQYLEVPGETQMTMDLGSQIDELYAKRAERLLIEKQVKELKEQETVLREALLHRLQDTGLQRASGAMATAGIKSSTKPIVTDWDQVYDYIKTNDRFDLVHQRISSLAWADLLAAGTLVPGTESFTELDVSLTKASR
jgi:hypothetical protein